MSTSPRCDSTPVACSMTIRLVRAVCSCSERVVRSAASASAARGRWRSRPPVRQARTGASAHDVEDTALVREQEAGRGDVQQPGAVPGQLAQQVDHVVALGQAAGEGHERACDLAGGQTGCERMPPQPHQRLGRPHVHRRHDPRRLVDLGARPHGPPALRHVRRRSRAATSPGAARRCDRRARPGDRRSTRTAPRGAGAAGSVPFGVRRGSRGSPAVSRRRGRPPKTGQVPAP